MPRKPLIRTTDFPYHVTARCNNKEHFHPTIQETWLIISNELKEIVERYECRLHAFVLMPNHFHLLISTPKDDLGIVMQSFLLKITKKINSKTGRTGRVFGSKYHWSLIDNEQYYDCVLKYIYRNPVKARLSESVEQYPYSTLAHVLEMAKYVFPIDPVIGHQGNIPNNNSLHFLHWLNVPFALEQSNAIKKGFQKTRFQPTRIGWKNDSKNTKAFWFNE